MDPNATLKELRELVALDNAGLPGIINRIEELFDALDEWLSRGGFPPDDWQPKPVTIESAPQPFKDTVIEWLERMDHVDEVAESPNHHYAILALIARLKPAPDPKSLVEVLRDYDMEEPT